MDLNWIDMIILGVIALGTLFGLFWGLLRMLFFVVTMVLVFFALDPAQSLFTGLITDVVFGGELRSQSWEFAVPLMGLVLGILVPFLIISLLLMWPYSVAAKHLNPFINFGMGGLLGAIIGFVMITAIWVIYSLFTVGGQRWGEVCTATFAPPIHDASIPLVSELSNRLSINQDMTAFFDDAKSALAQSDPRSASTCVGPN